MAQIVAPNIKNLSQKLLDNYSNGEIVNDTINEIYNYFQRVTTITGYDEHLHHNAAVPAKFGKALGLNHAAQCLLDMGRTVQFLRGLTEAIAEQQKLHPGETIKIFYAGCGPYAPFITLVAPLYSPEEVRFTLLDINSESLQSAQRLIEASGLVDYVEAMYSNDAITCSVPNADQYHILFSETLDSLLYRECYVPIIWNLLPQFSEDIVLIPQNVQLKMSFIHQDDKGVETESDPIVVFDSREAVASVTGLEELPDNFEPLKVPVDIESDVVAIALDTEVHVHNDLKLFRDQSDLTRPYAFDLDKTLGMKNLVFTYFLKPEVQLFTGTE